MKLKPHPMNAQPGSKIILPRLHLRNPEGPPDDVTGELLYIFRYRLYEQLEQQLREHTIEPRDGFYFSSQDLALRTYASGVPVEHGKRLTAGKAEAIIHGAIHALIPEAPNAPEFREAALPEIDDAMIRKYMEDFRAGVWRRLPGILSWLAARREINAMTAERAILDLKQQHLQEKKTTKQQHEIAFQQWLWTLDIRECAARLLREYHEAVMLAESPKQLRSLYVPLSLLKRRKIQFYVLTEKGEKQEFFTVFVEVEGKEADIVSSLHRGKEKKWMARHRLLRGEEREVSPNILCSYIAMDATGSQKPPGIFITCIKESGSHALRAVPDEVDGAVVDWIE